MEARKKQLEYEAAQAKAKIVLALLEKRYANKLALIEKTLAAKVAAKNLATYKAEVSLQKKRRPPL